MFGHSSWDTFRATTSSGKQVFHGFWNRVTSKTIAKWEVVNPEQCGETPIKVVVYVKEKFGGDKEAFHYAKMYIWEDRSETEVQESDDDDDEDDDATGGWKIHKISKERPYSLEKQVGVADREGYVRLDERDLFVDSRIADWAYSNGLAYLGCTDTNASNYDEDATCDDGSCECNDGYQKNDDGICEEVPPAEEIVAQGTATSVDGGANYMTSALLVGGVGLVGMLLILNKK